MSCRPGSTLMTAALRMAAWGHDRSHGLIAGDASAGTAAGSPAHAGTRPLIRRKGTQFCGVYQFEEGKVASYHLYFDPAGFLSQLGITPGD
jgi:hypothetical protein